MKAGGEPVFRSGTIGEEGRLDSGQCCEYGDRSGWLLVLLAWVLEGRKIFPCRLDENVGVSIVLKHWRCRYGRGARLFRLVGIEKGWMPKIRTVHSSIVKVNDDLSLWAQVYDCSNSVSGSSKSIKSLRHAGSALTMVRISRFLDVEKLSKIGLDS